MAIVYYFKRYWWWLWLHCGQSKSNVHVSIGWLWTIVTIKNKTLLRVRVAQISVIKRHSYRLSVQNYEPRHNCLILFIYFFFDSQNCVLQQTSFNMPEMMDAVSARFFLFRSVMAVMLSQIGVFLLVPALIAFATKFPKVFDNQETGIVVVCFLTSMGDVNQHKCKQE